MTTTVGLAGERAQPGDEASNTIAKPAVKAILAKAKTLCSALGFGVLIGLRVSFVMFPAVRFGAAHRPRGQGDFSGMGQRT
jgi:hypothetical protein